LEKISQKYTENFWNVAALFFFSEKTISKNKKYLPTMFAKESAMIPLVQNLDISTHIITKNVEYKITTIDIEEKYAKSLLLYQNR
jgi:hypothetical protein